MLELLELTRGYENLAIQPGIGVTKMGVIALVARSRYLFQRICDSADSGDSLVTAILIRTLVETVVTIAWINKDPELASSVWLVDDIRTRLSQHGEIAAIERRARRRSRRRGDPVPPLADGRSLGTLTRPNVRAWRRLERDTIAMLKEPRYTDRLTKLNVRRVNKMPTLRERADITGLEMIYELNYRFDSNSAAHPSPLAAEQFLEQLSDGTVVITAEPTAPRPDPYASGAVLFVMLLNLTGEYVDHSAIEAGIERVQRKLEALRPTAT